MPLERGQTILHFRLVEKIGAGGMGEVWKAIDTTLDREVAIKVLPAGLSGDRERIARLEREAKLLASLNHPNIAAIYGFPEADLALATGEKAALMEAKIAKKNVPLTEEEEIEIIARYEKKRRETLEESLKAGRKDLAAKEEAEIEVVRRFLPAAADETTVRVCVAHAIGATGATGPRDMGKVMGMVMKELKGRADGDVVSRIVKEMLAG